MASVNGLWPRSDAIETTKEQYSGLIELLEIFFQKKNSPHPERTSQTLYINVVWVTKTDREHVS